MPLPDPPDALKDANKRRNARMNDPCYDRSFTWLANYLPTAGDEKGASRATNELVLVLNNRAHIQGLKIDRVSKGGSLGRRTLVAGDYDVDLQILINGPMTYPDNWSRGQLMALLGMIRDYLEENEDCEAIVVEKGTDYDDVLQVKVNGVKADVLLVPNMVRNPDQTTDRVAEQRRALLGPLLANPLRAEADGTREAALAESLTEFVTKQDDSVKAVVRLMKAWYKYAIKPEKPAAAATARGRGKVPSVALELLVLAAGDLQASQSGHLQQTNECNRLKRFISALELLVEAVEQGAVVAVQAGALGYPLGAQRLVAHVWREHPVKIIHPIDPTCNVARPRKAGDPYWEGLAAEAKKLLHIIRNGTLDELVCGSTLAEAFEKLAGFKGERLPWTAAGDNSERHPAGNVTLQTPRILPPTRPRIADDRELRAAGREEIRFYSDNDDSEEAQTQYQQPRRQNEQARGGGCSIC